MKCFMQRHLLAGSKRAEVELGWQMTSETQDLKRIFAFSYLSDPGWSYLKGDCAPAANQTTFQVPISLKVLGTHLTRNSMLDM